VPKLTEFEKALLRYRSAVVHQQNKQIQKENETRWLRQFTDRYWGKYDYLAKILKKNSADQRLIDYCKNKWDPKI
jgi:hypothetical protein